MSVPSVKSRVVRQSSLALSALAAGVAATGVTDAAAADAPSLRPPMSEPILAETTTDIDSTEPGEMEVEVNVSNFRARKGGAFDLQLSPELEVLLTRQLGAKVEPFFERSRGAAPARPADAAGAGASLSWKLVQDFDHDFHLQLEAAGVVPPDTSRIVQPGESPLPFAVDVKSGFRRGIWTLRSSLGASAGGPSAHVPLHASAVLLTDLAPGGVAGFWGVELDVDGARANPAVVALDLVPNLTPVGLPFSFGFVLPYSIGADARAPSYGFFVKLFVESGRERGFARHPE